MYALINPGSGPVRAASSVVMARARMRDFIKALDIDGVRSTGGRKLDEGRADFRLSLGKRSVLVSMPGVTAALLTGSLPYAPRLYVDGNSWWWEFALSVVKDELLGLDEDA